MPLFESVLGERWSLLPNESKALHQIKDAASFSGIATVTRGDSVIARFLAWIFNFPPAAEKIQITVTKTRTEDGEIWKRDFAGTVFQSVCTPSPKPYHFREQFGPFAFEMELPVENGCMRLPVQRGWFFGLPIPRLFLPVSDSKEYVEDGVFHFDVALGAPLGVGLIVRYRGYLVPDRK